MQAVLEELIQDINGRSAAHLGAMQRILSAGAWVSKPGQHRLGRAFDLDAIHWETTQLIALQQSTQKPLYLAVQALCNKHFGVVLGYEYNPDHRDHLHVDIGRDVRFREASSVTFFLQQALNTFYGQTLKVDGEFGDGTRKALKEALATLGIPNVTTVANWKCFLDAVAEEGISQTAAAIHAEKALIA